MSRLEGDRPAGQTPFSLHALLHADLKPRMPGIDDLNTENDNLQRSQSMVVLYGCSHFFARREARRL